MKKETKEVKCERCSRTAFLKIVDLKDEYLKSFWLCGECCLKIPLKEFENNRYGLELFLPSSGELVSKGIDINEVDEKRVKGVLKLDGNEIYIETIHMCYWCGSQNPSITICESKNQKYYWICARCYQNIPIKEREEKYFTYDLSHAPSPIERLCQVNVVTKPTPKTYELLERYAGIDCKLDETLKKMSGKIRTKERARGKIAKKEVEKGKEPHTHEQETVGGKISKIIYGAFPNLPKLRKRKRAQ